MGHRPKRAFSKAPGNAAASCMPSPATLPAPIPAP
nr:MAG TPA: hypothetical protein [Caudoviricetes sp.]